MADVRPLHGRFAGRRRWRYPVACFGAATAAWAGFLILHLSFQGRWLGEFTGSVPPIAFIAVPAALTLSAIAMRDVRLAGVLCAMSLAVAGYSSADVHLVPASQDASCKGSMDELTLLNWNTQYWDQGSAPQGLIAFLQSQQPDAYTLQEVHYLRNSAFVDVPALENLVEALPGYRYVRKGDLLTLTRLPIVGSNAQDPTPYLRVDVLWGRRTVSLYNVHMPVHVDRDSSLLSADFYDFMQWRFAQRSYEFGALEHALVSNRGFIVLAGDFNATTAMAQMKLLRSRLVDTASVAGPIPPATIAVMGLRLWRPDYVLIDPALCVLAHSVRDPGDLSDHFAQLVRVGAPGLRCPDPGLPPKMCLAAASTPLTPHRQ